VGGIALPVVETSINQWIAIISPRRSWRRVVMMVEDCGDIAGGEALLRAAALAAAVETEGRK